MELRSVLQQQKPFHFENHRFKMEGFFISKNEYNYQLKFPQTQYQ